MLIVMQPAPLWADQYDLRLEGLFHALERAHTSRSAEPQRRATILAEISGVWAASSNPAIEILGERTGHALELGELSVAQGLAGAMVEISPSHVHGWFLLGRVHGRRAAAGDDAAFRQALDAYEQAISLEPRHFLALAAAGEAAAALGQDQEAFAYFKRAEVLYPGLPGVGAAMKVLSERLQAAEI